jgi:hypothetical protein
MSGNDSDDTTDLPSLPPVLNATDHMNIAIANDADDPTNQSCDPPVLNSTSDLTMSGNDNNDELTDSTERALTKEFNLCEIRAVKALKTYIRFQNADDEEPIKYNGQNFVKGKEGEEIRLLRTLIKKKQSRNNEKKNPRTVRSEAPTEESVRSTPTFTDWMSLKDGELLPVGKRMKPFLKGGKDEEERLIRYLVMNNRRSYKQQISRKKAKMNGEEGKPASEGMDLTRRREEEEMVVVEEEVALRRTEEETAARNREEKTAAWEEMSRELWRIEKDALQRKIDEKDATIEDLQRTINEMDAANADLQRKIDEKDATMEEKEAIWAKELEAARARIAKDKEEQSHMSHIICTMAKEIDIAYASHPIPSDNPLTHASPATPPLQLAETTFPMMENTPITGESIASNNTRQATTPPVRALTESATTVQFLQRQAI